jgi:lysozyme
MRVDYDVAIEIASHEAIVRQAYKDSVGVWTWSVGLTSATGHNVERYIGKPQGLTHCLAIYVWALERYANDVRQAFNGRELTKAQFAGALSFHWNTGAIKRASWVKKWLAGDIAGAKAAFMLWSTPKSIIGRRTKERDLFFSGKWSNDGTMLEYTRVTASGEPDWKSGRKIDVRKELAEALGQVPAPPPRPTPIDPPPVRTPTELVAKPTGFWSWLRHVFSQA